MRVTGVTGDPSAGTAPTEADWASDKRTFVLDERERMLDEREQIADQRDVIADRRERLLDERADVIDVVESSVHRSEREAAAVARSEAAVSRRDARRLVQSAVEVARAELARSAHVPPLLAQFAVLAEHLHGSATIEECLADIVQFTSRIVSDADEVTVSTFDRAVMRTRAATSEFARAIDRMQEQTREGPAREALRHPGGAVSGNLGDDARWPQFGRLAHGVGVLSALSVCMHLDREPTRLLGTINQYARTTDAFDRADVEIAIVLAAHAAVAIDAVGKSEELENIKIALRTRDVIGQAKGILMARGGLTADQAFDALRRASQLLNRRLAEIATDVVYLGHLPDGGEVGAGRAGGRSARTE